MVGRVGGRSLAMGQTTMIVGGIVVRGLYQRQTIRIGGIILVRGLSLGQTIRIGGRISVRGLSLGPSTIRARRLLVRRSAMATTRPIRCIDRALALSLAHTITSLRRLSRRRLSTLPPA